MVRPACGGGLALVSDGEEDEEDDALSTEIPLLFVWSIGNFAMRFFVMERLVFPAAHTTRPQSTCCSGASFGLRVTEVGLTALT